ncbi:MAG: hypothetical protein NXY59_07420 [Aigarchaeota archaeon]|nr:hypothetical protein [Candidatus Pelearchaeum maunauluense]
MARAECPLCGEQVTRRERTAAKYACLTVCIRAIRFPQHLIEKHQDYLNEASEVAKPVFFTALGIFIALLIQIITYAPLLSSLITVIALASVLGYGWYVRVKLLKKYRRLQSV